ncbi:mucin-like protein [Watersipora subatra]|uniref:mucin-like protein n=1 Tax=Watersipora subatra TaxID=2589382 RepID=UPI00355BDDC3
MSLLSDDWPQAHTQIYYHVYERAAGMSDQTAAILSRAEQDVSASAQGVDGFQAYWVLVVTWVNMAGDTGCRWPVIYQRIYSRYWWYSYWYNSWLNQYVEECKLRAETFELNHFQAVYITDGVYSFIKYNYPEEGINWVYPGIGSDMPVAAVRSIRYLYGVATGGFQSSRAGDRYARPTNYSNMWNSGALEYIDIDSVSGNMKDQRVGEWLFRVENSKGEAEARVQCKKWVSTQNWFIYHFFNFISHCPQNIWQAFWDPAFRTYSYQFSGRFSSWCMQSVFHHRFLGLKQRCCYDVDWYSDSFSALITEFPHHGHVVNPFNQEDEEDGYLKCCFYSTDTCKDFYSVRPVNDGRFYIPPVVRWWFGDPHIVTSDGLSYTFNGLGEYLFTKIGENDTVIQARTERVALENGTLGQATYFSAACVATLGLPSVQVQINKSPPGPGLANNTQLIVNGSLVDVSVIEEDANSTQSIEGVSSEIQFERSNVTLTVLFSSGVSLAVTPNNGMLTITLGLPSSVKGTTVGLTGTFDDDQENDLTYLNGTGHIPANSSESDIFEWGSTFAVSEEDSIMYYTDNTNWYTFNNNSFVPVFLDDIDNWVWSTEEFRTAAYDLCETDTSCLYDVYITGDLSIGESSKQTGEESEAANAQLNNFAPIINGNNSVLVIGGYFEYLLTVNDSNGDDVTVRTNINATITMTGDDVIITGQIANTTNTSNFLFTITARDTAGAASSKTLLTMFCNCVNNGTCDEPTQQQQEAFETTSIVLACICPTGYTGDLCDADLDACELVASPCYPSVLCVDLPPPADHEGYKCGDCPAGYTGDGKTCSDVDECTEDVCGHICINSPGSFVCACRTGYTLNIDGDTCDDVDECLTNPCHHVCINTAGAYDCTCDAEFVLLNDGINCYPANPCEVPSPCDQVNGLCNIEDGQDVCYCTKGYALSSDGVTCEDINECLLDTDACAQNCTNTAGGYTCSCRAGYSLALDETSCDDINECSTGEFNCTAPQICINEDGGYLCECPGNSMFIEGQCSVLSPTNLVAEITDSPSAEAEANSVLFFLENTTKNEYTVEKEITLFTLLAASANEICADDNCNLISVNLETKLRRKRSAHSLTFYKEYFSRLPGYPEESNKTLELAIYSLIPGHGVLPRDLLKLAIEEVSVNISKALGADSLYIVTTSQVTSTSSSVISNTAIASEPVTAIEDDARQFITYLAVSAALVLLTLLFVLFAGWVKRSKRTTKVSPSKVTMRRQRPELPDVEVPSLV